MSSRFSAATWLLSGALMAAPWVGVSAQTAAPAAAPMPAQGPDVLIQSISSEVLDAVRNDKSFNAGDVGKVIKLVDAKVMPHVNFQRMTALAVGKFWRQATPEQQKQLQEQFKLLLVRTYSGALAQVKDQSVQLKPQRTDLTAPEVVIRTEVRGKGDPIQLDYRLERSSGQWRIYDVNVLGVWLVENYRTSFAQEIGAGGIDGLIRKLEERNKAAAAKAA